MEFVTVDVLLVNVFFFGTLVVSINELMKWMTTADIANQANRAGRASVAAQRPQHIGVQNQPRAARQPDNVGCYAQPNEETKSNQQTENSKSTENAPEHVTEQAAEESKTTEPAVKVSKTAESAAQTQVNEQLK